MNRPLSTKEHGILDYATVGTLTVLPRLFGWEDRATRLLTGAAAGMLGYSLLTRYEMGVVKLLPMKAHLALDGASGALLCASPLLLRKKRLGIVATLIALGVSEIAAALLTKTRPPMMVQMQPVLPEAVPDQVSEAIQHRLATLRGR
ncbi:MAG: hypothetical protein IVW57_09690 [Ktedonobacterales bacterium]|nr:hypothetical protein [Ktedonobacterales bacterium]